MQTTRRAVRPDGQYYRNSRRQRLVRSLSEGVESRGVGGAWMILGGIGVALLLCGWRSSGWIRLAAFGAAIVSLLLLAAIAWMRRR